MASPQKSSDAAKKKLTAAQEAAQKQAEAFALLDEIVKVIASKASKLNDELEQDTARAGDAVKVLKVPFRKAGQELLGSKQKDTKMDSVGKTLTGLRRSMRGVLKAVVLIK